MDVGVVVTHRSPFRFSLIKLINEIRSKRHWWSTCQFYKKAFYRLKLMTMTNKLLTLEQWSLTFFTCDPILRSKNNQNKYRYSVIHTLGLFQGICNLCYPVSGARFGLDCGPCSRTVCRVLLPKT